MLNDTQFYPWSHAMLVKMYGNVPVVICITEWVDPVWGGYIDYDAMVKKLVGAANEHQ